MHLHMQYAIAYNPMSSNEEEIVRFFNQRELVEALL